jgi:hypothetical protein
MREKTRIEAMQAVTDGRLTVVEADSELERGDEPVHHWSLRRTTFLVVPKNL